MWIYTPHILHSSSCNHMAPSFAISTWKLGHNQIFPLSVWLCFAHTDITTSQHTSWALGTNIKGIIRHSYNTLGLYGDLHKKAHMLITPWDNSRHYGEINTTYRMPEIQNECYASHSILTFTYIQKNIWIISSENLIYL
jgi:hypothetical protein